LRESVYSRVAGMDFVVTAFKAAREADPDAVLIYNDYNCHKPGKREKLIEFLKRVMAAGAPVDAYGMQGYFELGDDSIPQLRETFDELRKLGLKVVVSELDIDVVTRGKWWADGGKYRDELASYDPYREGLPREVERRQVRQYVALFELFDEYSDMIERVSFWNLHDGQSWLNYFPWRRTNYPLLFDRERKPKPVFDVVYRTLRNQAQEHVGVERKDANSVKAHEDLLAKTRQGRVDVYFQGDSITRRWGATDYPQLLDHWRETFHGWNAANFAWGGDSTHNMLWRMQHGELEGVDPRVVVLQAGANNLPWRGAASADRVDDVVGGVRTLVDEFQQRFPGAEIILTAMFPRSQNPDLRPAIEEINERLEALAEGRGLRFLNINAELMDRQGALRQEMSRDGLHLEKPGYEVWGRALRPVLEEILGPRSGEDFAPPPTGDPSAGAGRGALGG
jgi:lysophospholipase L1-like esterase